MARNNYPFHLVPKDNSPFTTQSDTAREQWDSLNELTLSMHKAARKRATMRRVKNFGYGVLLAVGTIALTVFAYYTIAP